MSDAPALQPCANCGRQRPPGELHGGWCDVCRAEVVRRATLPARLAAGAFALLLLALLVWMGGLESRFLVMWLALLCLAVFAAYKVARRVAFEVVRSRGVTPPAGPP
ncbi:MAG TPA: hypothetical protein VFH27_17625 [Longimicrobiaceae bacterium]|nr:hypothetical protein [Longimicrobiaceae bacterium]